MEGMDQTLTLSGGTRIPQVGLGVWKITDEKQMYTAIETALAAGYRHIDTAAAYGNEELVGKAIQESGRRKELFLTTKLWNEDQTDPERALETSLDKLKTDYVDLYLMHWPSPWRGQYVEAWKTMSRILGDGRARAIGVSNFKPAHLEKIIDATGVVPAINQVERHPLFQQHELQAYCEGLGIQMEAYSPLSAGRLPEYADKLSAIANRHNKSAAQIVLRWQIQTGWVVIPKSVTPERIKENAQLFDFALDAAEMRQIADLDAGRK